MLKRTENGKNRRGRDAAQGVATRHLSDVEKFLDRDFFATRSQGGRDAKCLGLGKISETLEIHNFRTVSPFGPPFDALESYSNALSKKKWKSC